MRGLSKQRHNKRIKNRGMHGDSLCMLGPLGLSNRKPLPLGMGYITGLKTFMEYIAENYKVYSKRELFSYYNI